MNVAARGKPAPVPHIRPAAANWTIRLTKLAVFLAIFLPYANLILYHFYVQGAFFRDSGFFAGVVYRQSMMPQISPIFIAPSPPLFALHVQLLFLLLNGLSWCLPLNMPTYFAIIMGIGHALPAVGVFSMLIACLRQRTLCGIALAAALAIGFGFSGIALAIARFPHPEILIAGGAIMFCASLALGHRVSTYFWFIFTLLTREDAGFHLCGILLLSLIADRLRGSAKADHRRMFALSAAAFVFSSLLVTVQHIFWSRSYAPLSGIYLGNPPFHSLSFKLVGLRLLGLFVFRPYVALPGLVALAWAIQARNIVILAGYLAFLPWLALQLLADSKIAGTLSGYYAFPFLIAAAWPLSAIVMEARALGRPPPTRYLIFFAALIGASDIGIASQWDNDAHFDLWRGFTGYTGANLERVTDQAVATLRAGETMPGGLTIDESIASLAPYGFNPRDAFDPATGRLAETTAYFRNGPQAHDIRQALTAGGPHLTYAFVGTFICVASKRHLDSLPGLRLVVACSS